MSVLTDVAVAVKNEINTGVYSQAFTAVRAYVPQYELSELSDLTVTVVAKSVNVSSASRRSLQYECVVDIAIQQRCDPSDLDTLDNLMTLGEEIIESLADGKLVAMPEASCSGIGSPVAYSMEHLRENRQFTGVIEATYLVLANLEG